MANVWAIHSVGNSIVTFLRNGYPQEIGGTEMPACGFEMISTGQLAGEIDETTRITLYLYRVTVDEHTRQRRRPGRSEGPVPLGVDLHFMLTAWAANPLDEQVPFAWAMRQLHQVPVLDLALLSPDGGWGRDEAVQIAPAELSAEDLMRIWDSLDPPYRLSAPYLARVVRLDPDEDDEVFEPVVARRFAVGEEASP